MTDPAGKSFIDLTATIVSAYVSNNPTPAAELPGLIGQIHAALRGSPPVAPSRRRSRPSPRCR